MQRPRHHFNVRVHKDHDFRARIASAQVDSSCIAEVLPGIENPCRKRPDKLFIFHAAPVIDYNYFPIHAARLHIEADNLHCFP
jgi:hypothetical protein